MSQKSEHSGLIRRRAAAKVARERQQLQLMQSADLHHSTIETKLTGLLFTAQFLNFKKCGKEEFYRTCRCCGTVTTYNYRCSLKWCPRCQWWLQKRRAEKLRLWAQTIKQPKHLVLTQTNFATLTRRTLREHTKALQAIRRTNAFQKVRGGSVSTEITNESKGWHLHTHWLLDCDWLDMPSVSRSWASAVGQKFAIVKIKDVRGTEYVQEVSKYLAKSSEIAGWAPDLINQFVRAIHGRRFFNTFGSLWHLQSQIRAELERQRPSAVACACGSSDFLWETETGVVLNELRHSR